MSLFNKPSAGGFMDEIRCDEPSYLIWKWHPNGSQAGNNNRENAVRWGSSLRVKDGEVAVFVYKQKDGTVQEFIEGPFDKKIETKNLPIIASMVSTLYEGGTPFQAEIYFINLARIIQAKFAVPFFDIFDPRFTDFGVPVAVRGTISFKISEYREFIKLHRLQDFNLDSFQHQIEDAVSRYVKDIVANAPASNNISVLQIESKVSQINDAVEYDIKERMKDNFGIDISGVDIGAIEIDKSSDNYSELLAVTKEIATSRLKAENADYVERLKIQREEGQYAQHKSTQSANLGAFQTEKQAEVGVAGAEALGKMGENGAGGVDLGGNDGAGFNPASMMAGMTIGSAIGQNIIGAMKSNSSSVVPPIPTDSFYIALNGQPAGPYNIATLQQMEKAGTFTKENLVWKQGMENWVKAESVDELKTVFCLIPPIPKEK